jgi:transcription elongation factor Elf1
MQTVTCDICKKKVDNLVIGSTFFYYANHGVCEACKDNLELQIKTAIRGTDPFSYEWYDQYVDDTISKAIQKGKN